MSQARRNRRAAARAASKAAQGTALAVRSGDNVVDINKLKLVLQEAVARGPERGTRTPQPSITWSQSGNAASYGELSFDRLMQILRSAEEGSTTDWIDLTRRMLRTDSHLASVWETRIVPIAASRWDLEPGDSRDATVLANAVRLADACREALDAIPDLAAVMLCLLEGIGTDFGVGEIVWARGSLLGIPATVPTAIAPIHPRRFAFDLYYRLGLWDLGRAVDELRRAGHDTEIGYGRNVALLPAGKYIVHQPATIHDWPTSRGLFFSIARQWWVKQWVTKYWLQGAETGANPRTVGKVSQEAVGDDVVDDLKSALETLAADGVAILRGGTDVEWRDGIAEGSARVWHELYDCMDEAMSKRILGSTLNVQIGETGGAYAAADSQAATTILPRQLIDAEQMWLTFQRDLFRWIRDYNPHLFPPNTPLPKGHSILAEERVNVDELAVRARVVTNDELRISRALPEWGGAKGEALAILDGGPAAAIGPSAGVSSDTTVQDTALNGAQTQSLVQIGQLYKQGLISLDFAVFAITKSFPTISDAEAHRALGLPVPLPAAPAPEVAAPARPFSTRLLPWEQATTIATSARTQT